MRLATAHPTLSAIGPMLFSAVVALGCAWTLRAPAVSCTPRTSPVRMDSDRCYYGNVDADGEVVKMKEARAKRTVVQPSPSLSPTDVVDAQFAALAEGSEAALRDAFAFVSPTVVEKYGMDMAKFRSILEGAAFEGLIGCDSWTVKKISEPSDEVAVVTLRVLPKPIPGCVRTSGLAGQQGITWPSFYSWQLGRQPAGSPFAGCWMLDNMAPERPPIDVDAAEGVQAAVSPAQS